MTVDRRERVQGALRDAGLDAAVLVSPPNMAYVVGFRPNPHERLIALVVPADGPLRLVVPSLEEEAARSHVPADTEVHAWRDDEGPTAAVAAALAGAGTTVGIEKSVLTVTYHELLQQAAPGLAFADCGSAVGALRLRKDEAEVALLRRAAEVIDRVVARLEPELQPGRSEAELAALTRRLIGEEGGDAPSFEPLILTGARSALPHGSSDGTLLAAGDLVIVDVGAVVGGYCSDITRTFVCGREPDARQRELYALVQAGQAAAVAAAVAGATGGDVDRAARGVIAAGGHGAAFVHRTGHGLGLEIHEPPSLHGANDEPLPDGAAVTVEPGVYLPGYGGVRIEDDVIVRPGAPDVLTRFPIGLERKDFDELRHLPVRPHPVNEPPLDYAPGSPERAEITAALARVAGERIAIPHVIGGREVETARTMQAVMPHRHAHVLADVATVERGHVEQAIAAAAAAAPAWAALPWEERAAVMLPAAELLSGPWRSTINAATMLNQSKTVHQAEIDAACELADFLRFNVHYLSEIYASQPRSSKGVWNRLEYRPLEGFVLAVSPFNFTAIGGNLTTAPALLGNTVLWKPASTAALAAHHLMRMFREAGLPDGVINLVYGSGSTVGDVALSHPSLAGIHFTGSTGVFQHMWRTVGENIAGYRSYPRLVGETGGKDFIVAHPSADVDVLATAVIRGSFEYQGQKCSAASRAYVPSNLWPALREKLESEVSAIRVGDVADLSNYMGAVIDAASFAKQRQAIAEAREQAEVVVGGGCDDSVGWFVEPTVVLTRDPGYRLLCEELFGPVLTVYVYPEGEWSETLKLVDSTSPYALTGAVISTDRAAIAEAHVALRHAAGNFYVNDKPTGAVVGQQPFGGARASGTNDKAGSIWNLLRWVSVRTIKETFDPPKDYRYPFLDSEGA